MTIMNLRFTILLAAFSASAFAADAPVPTKQNLSAVLQRYLADHGQLCVGKYDWPITVTQQDVANGDRNAVQMPAMLQAGLVQALPTSDGVLTYRLTETGQRYYWPRAINRRDGVPGQTEVHDFCAGRLTLDHLVRWTPPVRVGDDYEATATYTYAVAPAAWTANPQLQQVFPMIARVIKGQHSAELAQRVRFHDGRWDAVPSVE